MDKIETVIDVKAAKQYLSPLVKFIIFCLACFLVMVSLYVLFSLLNHNWLEPLNFVFLAVALIGLIGAILFSVKYLKSLHIVKNNKSVVTYEFFDDHFLFTSINKNNEKVDEREVPYTEIVNYRESKDYYFLLLASNSAFIIDKNEEVTNFIKEKGFVKQKTISAKK